MKITTQQIHNHLKTHLKSAYLLCGDEIVLVNEVYDALHQKIKAQGFSEWIRLSIDKHFNWDLFLIQTQSYSLFGEKKCLDIELVDLNLSQASKTILNNAIENLPADLMMIIRCKKLSPSQMQMPWIKTLDQIGVIVQIWPLEKQLLPWLKQHCQDLALTLSEDSLIYLKEKFENNPLAAKQMLQKLRLIYEKQAINVNMLEKTLIDESRYDCFKFVDALLNRDLLLCLKILSYLKNTQEPPILILWAIGKECRLLAKMAYTLEKTPQSIEKICQSHGVWSTKVALIQNALRYGNYAFYLNQLEYCAKLDQIIKGQKTGDIWMALNTFCLAFCEK